MAQVDIQPYLGYTEADKQDTPLNFEHLLSKDKVSKYMFKTKILVYDSQRLIYSMSQIAIQSAHA